MIKLLDKTTINKIAAGEVVERPFSVIKELVENSIDAGSSKIVIEIKEGGISFIRVTDNGIGIPAEQIEIAFTSHATSKISDISDLNTIRTLGFRGEALASIASVSQLEVMTKTSESVSGIYLEIFGGEIIGKKEAVCNTGTVITMRNLFYNTPARKKFLKSVSAETGYISDFIGKIALSRPDISFRYINNGAEVLFTSGSGDLKTAIFSIYGMEYTENLIQVDYEQEGITIGGFIGKPQISRANRMFEDIFVNGRYVKDKTIGRAAEDAYKTYLTINRFPAFVLNVVITDSGVDVNAHPQKLEIRFANDEEVYNAVYSAVDKALKSSVLIHQADFWKTAVSAEVLPVLPEKNDDSYVYSDLPLQKVFSAKEAEVYVIDKPIDITAPFADFEGKIFETVRKESIEQPSIIEEKLFSNYKIVGQVFSTYWLIEETGKLYIIDQHAAHERILFEDVKKRLEAGDIVIQALLVPERLPLTDREKGIIYENTDYFESIGFEIEENEGDYYLKSIPMLLSSPENSATIRQLVDMLADGYLGGQNIYDTKINTIATIACKAAVKGHDRISAEEAKAIITSLLSLENPFTCPHGRPTIVELTKNRLEQMFKRS